MKTFTIIDPATGQVQYTGQCADADFDLQRRPFALLVEGHYPRDRFYWDGQQMVTFPPRPSSLHVWNFSAKRWERSAELADQLARKRQRQLLAASNETQLMDVPAATRDSWKVYRQQLRDVPAQPGYPFSITWPEPPQ